MSQVVRLTYKAGGRYCVCSKAVFRIEQPGAPPAKKNAPSCQRSDPSQSDLSRFSRLGSPPRTGYFRFARDLAATTVPANAIVAKATFTDRTRCMARCTTPRRSVLRRTGRWKAAGGEFARRQAPRGQVSVTHRPPPPPPQCTSPVRISKPKMRHPAISEAMIPRAIWVMRCTFAPPFCTRLWRRE